MRTLPSTTCISYTLSGRDAGPLTTAPVVMSNSEPWHWHMIVVPVSRPPESGHDWPGHLRKVFAKLGITSRRELHKARPSPGRHMSSR